MDERITRLLGARLGLNEDECASLREGGAASVLSSRLANQSTDPIIGMLLSSMLQRPDSAESPPAQRTPGQRSRGAVRDLKERLAAADGMARYIADVFGACRSCWGLEAECSECEGRGSPGSREPAEAELLSWVQPALSKLGMAIVKKDDEHVRSVASEEEEPT